MWFNMCKRIINLEMDTRAEGSMPKRTVEMLLLEAFDMLKKDVPFFNSQTMASNLTQQTRVKKAVRLFDTGIG